MKVFRFFSVVLLIILALVAQLASRAQHGSASNVLVRA
jgi:hypothetical protein